MSASDDQGGRGRVHFVSLGCPKNRVDSELMLGSLAEADFDVAADPDDADLIVVNTCGFIEDAKKESIDVIFEMARAKEVGRPKKLIVTGCLVQRYADELSKEIPEIDALLGNGEYQTIADWAMKAIGGRATPRVKVEAPTFGHDASSPRLNTFLPHSTYVKVAEGCDQKCTFCIIPALRGLQRSRPIEDVVREAELAASRGVVELNLVAQDLTGYGHDLSPKKALADLLAALSQVDGIRWIRLHYAYPRPFSKALLASMQHEKVLPYLDIPLQHIADPVLARMKRGRPRRFIEKLLADVRKNRPDTVVRTSFIVGFPGETEADFRELVRYIEGEDFERVGVFKFSREEGTPSHDMGDQVPPEVVEARYHELMGVLQERSRKMMASYVGRKLEVLVDGVSEETELLLAARHKGQAPEVDGTTYINDGSAKAGDIVEVEISEAFDYDLVGAITRTIHAAPPRPDHARLDTGYAPQRGHKSLRIVKDAEAEACAPSS